MDIAKIRKKLKQGGGNRTRKVDGRREELDPSTSRNVPSDSAETGVVITPPRDLIMSDEETLDEVSSDTPGAYYDEEESVPTVELLSFKISGRLYAFRVEDVQEILRKQPVTPVPGAALFLAGITSLRGTIIPVMDMGLRLSSDNYQTFGKWAKILVAYGPKGSIGVILEGAVKVLTVPASSLEEVPDGLSDDVLRFISGVTRVNRQLVYIIDVEKLFNFSGTLEA